MKRYFMLYFLLVLGCLLMLGNLISLTAYGSMLTLQQSNVSTLSPRAGILTLSSSNPNLYIRGVSITTQGSPPQVSQISVTIYNAGNGYKPSLSVKLYDDSGMSLFSSSTGCPNIPKNNVKTCSVSIPNVPLAQIRSIEVTVA